MKLPVPMLRDFVETPLTAEEIGDLLTMAGFELEGLEVVEGDAVLDLKVMANRGDGLSALGMAREVLAKDGSARATDLYRRASERFPAEDAAVALVGVEVEIATDACSRYACRRFDSVQNGDSPEWLQKRLRQAAMRPISLLVDLTNYVLLELGQPLHAFDLDRLSGSRIVVRDARPAERLTTLDGANHELREGQMMICDAEKPVAAAGIMGGEETEVSASTRRMLLESAHFDNGSVRRTRKKLGISTEASYRFERWVDPEGVVAALNRVRELYASIAGDAGCVPGVLDVYPSPPRRRQIEVRASRARKLLGVEVDAAECRRHLESLGFAVSGDGEPFKVEPPTWRPDVEREEDAIEEIGRVHGFDRIPEVLPEGATTLGGSFGIYGFMDRIRASMSRLGFTQIVSHSLRDQHPLDFRENERVEVRNPHSPEMALLRNSNLPGLAEAARRNAGREGLHLYELGKVFVKGDVQFDESPELAVLSVGALHEPSWGTPDPPVADFFSMKGAIEQLARSLRTPVTFDLPLNLDPRLHPARQSSVLGRDGSLHVGIFGQIHPDVAEECGLPEGTLLAELDVYVLHMLLLPDVELRAFSRNPAVRRDMAILVDKTVPYEALQSAIQSACGDVLERMWLFDVYEGKGIPEGSHSLAVALQLRKHGGNFTDEEANQVRDRAAEALATLGARLR